MIKTFTVMSQSPSGLVLCSRQKTRAAALEVKDTLRSVCGCGIEVDDDFVYVIIDLESAEAAREELAESGFDLKP